MKEKINTIIGKEIEVPQDYKERLIKKLQEDKDNEKENSN